MTRHRAALLVVLLAAFFVRVWQLPHTPPGLWYDEAYNGMDVRWMVDTGQYPPFLVGNNGREALVHYLLLLSTSVLGQTPLAGRAVGALAGFLTIPIIYRLAWGLLGAFAQSDSQRRWLALAAAAWLAVSWWHLQLSRLGLRPVLLPPLLMLSLYFFWQGITTRFDAGVQKRSFWMLWMLWGRFILAGLFLGLSQYTYLSARLAPLILAGFALLRTAQIFISRKSKKTEQLGTIRNLWLGLILTALTAALVFLPLGLFFLNQPDAFSARTGDVLFAPRTFGQLAGHLLQAVSLFLGAGHELYRHHLPGRAMLGWLEIPFFWVGLVWLLRRLRQPTAQLILLGLAVMWLPALLASPPVHALRPVGMLPFYYLIVTLGLNEVSPILYRVLRILYHTSRNTQYAIPGGYLRHTLPLALAVFIPLNGLINAYDYFNRWTNHPEVYKEYNGPLVDLTHHLLDLSQTEDILLPLPVYLHPTTRYLLGPTFPEQPGPPPAIARPVEMVIIPDLFQSLYVGNIPASPAMVLLTRDAAGQGAAYISRLPRADEQAAINTELAAHQPQLKPFKDRLGRVVAQFLPLSTLSAPLCVSPLFDPTPLRVVNATWPNSAALTGYDVTPNPASPGQPVTLNFYWRSLTDKSFDYRFFLQLINGAGQPVNQWEGDAFREDMYRWRPNGLLPTQHTLWLGPDTPPGPYLVRLGFFDEVSGQRLPLRINDNAVPADQIQLGLFYVTADGHNPRQPAVSLSANFANSLQLIGVTLPSLLAPLSSPLPVTLHWQTLTPTPKPYTVFLQLLNERGQVVSGWDRQPFDGLYPTNLWSPDEVVAATLPLPLPEAGLPPGRYRLITGFYDGDTGQRLMVVGGGDFTQVSEFEVK